MAFAIHATPLEREFAESINAIRVPSGAGDGIRTRDFHLGKVAFYH